MNESYPALETASPLHPVLNVLTRSDSTNRRLRFALVALMLVELVSAFVPQIFCNWPPGSRFLPQIMIGIVVLALILAMDLNSQRKSMHEVSSALIAATSYAERLEQISVIDLPTQLFNRRYLDDLFNHQLTWLKRHGKSATLMLLEVFQTCNAALDEDIVLEAAFVLRSNFRGSDYVVRYSANQFLVVLLDTDVQKAQVALCRLIDKVDHWNENNRHREMALHLEMDDCPLDGSIFTRLGKLEEKLRDRNRPDARKLVRVPRALDKQNIADAKCALTH